MPPEDEANVYRTCMEKVRQRVGVIRWLNRPDPPLGSRKPMLTTELTHVQFRKTLELIAYASLIVHKDAYAQAHPGYTREWRAVKMLARIEKLNPHFFPRPLGKLISKSPDVGKFGPPPADALTRDDFVTLYDASAEVLHMRNPYSEASLPVLRYGPMEYAMRIQRLVARHQVKLLDGAYWIVTVPGGSGDIQVARAEPIRTEGQRTSPLAG